MLQTKVFVFNNLNKICIWSHCRTRKNNGDSPLIKYSAPVAVKQTCDKRVEHDPVEMRRQHYQTSGNSVLLYSNLLIAAEIQFCIGRYSQKVLHDFSELCYQNQSFSERKI